MLGMGRGQIVAPGNLAGLGGAHIEPRARLFDGSMRYADGCPAPSFDPAARVALLDEWGLDACLSFPTIGILWVSDDPALASAHCRAYNTWMSEYAAAADHRVLWAAHLNLLDPEEAARELDRCLARGASAVFVPPEPTGGRRPGDPAFDPIWKRCAEAGIPLCLHVVVRFSGVAANPLAGWFEAGGMSLLFGFSLGATIQVIPALVSMISDGLFDRIPDLRVLCVEAGAGWAAYVMDRMDEKYDHFSWLNPLAMKPSDYFRRNVWLVAEPGERTIDAQLDLVGEDRILWGSDYPHIDSSLDAPAQITASVAGLSDIRRAAVLGGNAARLFGLSGDRS